MFVRTVFLLVSFFVGQTDTLSPPPICLGKPYQKNQLEIIWIEGKPYAVSMTEGKNHEEKLDLKAGTKRGNGGEEDPWIIEIPGNKFLVKRKGKSWVRLDLLEGDTQFLLDLLRTAKNIKPPLPPGGNGNGDGSN